MKLSDSFRKKTMLSTGGNKSGYGKENCACRLDFNNENQNPVKTFSGCYKKLRYTGLRNLRYSSIRNNRNSDVRFYDSEPKDFSNENLINVTKYQIINNKRRLITKKSFFPTKKTINSTQTNLSDEDIE